MHADLIEQIRILQILHGFLEDREGFIEEEWQGDVGEVLPQGLLENRPHDGPYAAVVIFLLWGWQGIPSCWRGVHLSAKIQSFVADDCWHDTESGK